VLGTRGCTVDCTRLMTPERSLLAMKPFESVNVSTFAVTVARISARSEGVVIAANWWGKVKTGVQVLTIFLLILLVPSPTWIDWLVYLMVAVTVISGVDYFFGMRRLMREAELRRAQPREGSPQ